MKKILIPTILTTAIIPLTTITSCGEVVSVEWHKADGQFNFDHELIQGRAATTEDATRMYFENLDMQTLADDMVKKRSDKIFEDSNYDGFVSVEVSRLDKIAQRLSFKLHFHFEDYPTNSRAHYHDSIVTVVNLPFEMKHYDDFYETKTWLLKFKGFDIDSEQLPDSYWNDSSWSYTQYTVIDSREPIEFTLNYHSDKDSHLVKRNIRDMSQFYIRSYLFSQVEPN